MCIREDTVRSEVRADYIADTRADASLDMSFDEGFFCDSTSTAAHNVKVVQPSLLAVDRKGMVNALCVGDRY